MIWIMYVLQTILVILVAVHFYNQGYNESIRDMDLKIKESIKGIKNGNEKNNS